MECLTFVGNILLCFAQIALLCAVLAVGESIALLTPEQYAQEYVSGVDRLVCHVSSTSYQPVINAPID